MTAHPSGPLVSIVTPCLNRANLLDQTIRSVIGQSYKYVEHIVVDGGSTDGTLDMLREYELSNHVRWISEPDGGMYEAVNKGLRLANGEILAYLNSDDLYFPWSLQVVVEAFDRTDGDVVFGDAIRLDELQGGHLPFFTAPFNRRLTVANGSIVQPTVFFRKRVLDDIGPFDESLRYVADLDFWLRASKNHHIEHVEEFLALDRIHDASLSESRREEMAAEDRAMRDRHRSSLRVPAGASIVARLRAGTWRRRRWLKFVQLSRTKPASGGPWSHLRSATTPRISSREATLALIPRIGRRHLARIGWGTQPVDVALGAHQQLTGTAHRDR